MKKLISLILFWLGTLYIFVASWLVMWWVAPVWQKTPIEKFNGTAWAFAGPIYNSIGLSLPVGIILVGIGIALYAEVNKNRTWQLIVLIGLVIFASLTIILVPSLEYHPKAYGIFGLFILIFFFAAVWFWAQKRKTLQGKQAIAADMRLVGYIFFYLAANFSCTLLGNPISGLFFPEKVLHYQSLPVYYSMGLKQALYFAFGFLFLFLGNFITRKAEPSG